MAHITLGSRSCPHTPRSVLIMFVYRILAFTSCEILTFETELTCDIRARILIKQFVNPLYTSGTVFYELAHDIRVPPGQYMPRRSLELLILYTFFFRRTDFAGNIHAFWPSTSISRARGGKGSIPHVI
jgi:hypothetical protein